MRPHPHIVTRRRFHPQKFLPLVSHSLREFAIRTASPSCSSLSPFYWPFWTPLIPQNTSMGWVMLFFWPEMLYRRKVPFGWYFCRFLYVGQSARTCKAAKCRFRLGWDSTGQYLGPMVTLAMSNMGGTCRSSTISREGEQHCVTQSSATPYSPFAVKDVTFKKSI